jgi:DNA-binding NarL/FixJ family response regulator
MTEPLLVTSFDHLRIVVIDDDRAVAELVGGFLQAAKVGSIVKVSGALAALNLLADPSRRADCIICDHSMGIMTGLALLKEIRSGRHKSIPRNQTFIMLTSHSDEPVVKAALALDVNGYLRKPVTKDAVVKALHRAYGRKITLKSAESYAAVELPAEN